MRKAFTLIELMIAITLTALLLTLLYNASDTITKGGEHYSKIEKELIENTQKIQKLLTLDLLGSDINSTFISNAEPDKPTNILIHTSNSLHRMENPWVLYETTDNGELLRIESPYRPKFPLNQAMTPNISVDIICKNSKKFNIYKKKNELLIIFQCYQNRPAIFKLILPTL